MGTGSSGLAISALLGLLLGQARPASAAVICVQTYEVTGKDWEDPFVKRLRDQGLARPDRPICATAMLSGEIMTGDARALEAIVQANIPFLGRLALNSNGGNVDEAMQIGRVARRYYLETEAPSYWDGQRPHWLFGGKITEAPRAICASSCFFVWLGGVNRTGDALGIHRPFPPATEMQKLSPAAADRLYRGLSGEILAYLSEMDAAPHWLNDMMRIPSDELQMIPEEQIRDELG